MGSGVSAASESRGCGESGSWNPARAFSTRRMWVVTDHDEDAVLVEAQALRHLAGGTPELMVVAAVDHGPSCQSIHEAGSQSARLVREPLVEIFSPTHCRHDVARKGRRQMPVQSQADIGARDVVLRLQLVSAALPPAAQPDRGAQAVKAPIEAAIGMERVGGSLRHRGDGNAASADGGQIGEAADRVGVFAAAAESDGGIRGYIAAER